MWPAGRPGRAGAGNVWGAWGKNAGGGYSVGVAGLLKARSTPRATACGTWALGCPRLGEVALFTYCRSVAHWLNQGCGPGSAEVREVLVSTCWCLVSPAFI